MPENLADNFDFSYHGLLRFLGKGKEGYIFCRADDLRFIPKINETLVHDLGITGIRAVVIYLKQDSDEPLLYQLEQAALPADALIVANLYEVATASEKGLNNLTELNFAREAIWQIRKPIVFWADAQSMHIIANHAPDLYSQRRHTTVHFTGMLDVPVAEKLQKDGWETFLSSEQFNKIKTDIDILENRLRGARAGGYPALRTVREIALPLARNYALRGMKDEARKVINEYEDILRNTDDEGMLRQIADVYYGLHECDEAILALRGANELIAKKYDELAYPMDWFVNLIDIADWSKEIGYAEPVVSELVGAATLLEHQETEWRGRTLSFILERLGDIIVEAGDLPGARKYYERSLQIREQLIRDNPHSEPLQRDLGVSFNKLGDTMEQLGNLQEAKKYYERSLQICEQMSRDNPHSEPLQRDLGVSYERLGDTMRQLGNLQEAKKYYDRSLQIRKHLSSDNPHSEPLQRDLGVSYERLGDSIEKLGDLQEAKKYYERLLQICEQLSSENPHSEQLQRDLGVSYERIAGIFEKEGDLKNALKYYEDGLAIVQRLSLANPLRQELKNDIAYFEGEIARLKTV